MATDKVAAYWLDIADEDLGVAEDLYNAKALALRCVHVPSSNRKNFEGILVWYSA